MGQITKTTAAINALLDDIPNKADAIATAAALASKADTTALPTAATDGEITAGTVTGTRTISPAQAKSAAKTFGVEKFANYAALPSPSTFGVGVAQTADTGSLYYCNGVSWKFASNLPWEGRTPKITTIGNSINAYNCYNTTFGGVTRGFTPAGHMFWIRALSGHGFDYTRCFPITDRNQSIGSTQLQTAWSSLVKYTLGDEVTSGGNRYWCAVAASLNQDPTTAINQVFGTGGSLSAPWVLIPSNGVANSTPNWTINSSGGGREILDFIGNYGAPSNTSTNILTRLQSKEYFQRFIDTPDIVYFANFFENSVSTAGHTLNSIIAELNSAIDSCQKYWPNAWFIVATPGPSENNNGLSGNIAFQQSIRNHLLTTYSRDKVFIENHNSWYRGDPANGLFDARYGEYYSPDGISSNGWAFNGTAGTVNIHPGATGAIIRAKRFLQQFSWMSIGRVSQLPPGSGIVNDTTKVISDDGAGNGTGFLPVFAFNPDYKQTGAPTGLGASTNNKFVWIDNSGTNVISTPANVTNGLQVTFGSSGALSGTLGAQGASNTCPNSNTIEVGVRWGQAKKLDMSTYGASNLFQAASIIKITDPKNLYGIISTIYTATFGAWTDGTQRNYSYSFYTNIGGGTWDLPGCLVAGDILTIVSPHFGFGNNPDLVGLGYQITQGASSVAYTGPVLEFRLQELIRSNKTGWY